MLTVEEARRWLRSCAKTGRLDCTANQLILMYEAAIKQRDMTDDRR